MKNREVKQFYAFTLVELLVVISIIALLLSILMPSLGRARQQAYRSSCASNLSQLNMSWQLYHADNDSFLVSPYTSIDEAPLKNNWVADGNDLGNEPSKAFDLPSSSYMGRRSRRRVKPEPDDSQKKIDKIGGTKQAIKDGALWPYTGEPKIYQCRAAKYNLNRSYAIAYTMGGERKENDSRDGIKPFREFGEIDKPGKRMTFADSRTEHRFLYGPFWPIEIRDDRLKFKPYDGFNGQYMANNHRTGDNYSFADMHVEFLRYKNKETVEMIEKINYVPYERYHGKAKDTERETDMEIVEAASSKDNIDLKKMITYLKGRKK